MKVKQKILVAFLVMLLVPGILIGLVGKMTFDKWKHEFGDGETYQTLLHDPMRVLTELTDTEYNELCTASEVYPERLQNDTWLNGVNDALTKKYSYLVLVRNGETCFVGDEVNFDAIRAKVLRTISSRTEGYDGAVIVNNNVQTLVKQKNVTFSNGDPGCFIIVTKSSYVVQRIERTVLVRLIIVIGITVMLAGILYFWICENVIKPLESLRQATRRIGKGDLNFTLKRDKQDEIGQLCNDFEEMRRHLKTTTDQKEQYEQDIREMISNVSHDLKTPLTTIKGYAEGMLDGVAGSPERQEKYLKTIVVKAGDMTMLVDELSYYAKLDNNKLPYKFEKVNAVEYFGDCVEQYKTELEMKDFTVTFDSKISSKTKVVIDCEQIRRVMNNLIGNSVKYRTEGVHGTIEVKLTDTNDSVRISVTDNGIGISKDAQKHIFERFYRADKSRTSGRAGTGIGLAIVDKIVKEHKGRVFVKSELGKGTTISFTVKKGEQ